MHLFSIKYAKINIQMNESGYFISHSDGLVVIYVEWQDKENSADSGYIVKKVYIDEEGFFTVQHKKGRSSFLREEGIFTNPRKVIRAIFDENKDSWSAS